jgi:hydrogenase-4 component E
MSKQVIVEGVVVGLVLTDFLLLGSSRLRTCVRMLGTQGLFVGLLPLLLHASGSLARAVLLAAGSLAIKGVAFPWLLLRVLRDLEIRREVEPFIGYISSLLAGLAALVLSVWLGARLVPPGSLPGASLLVSAGLATIWVGLVAVITRRKAVSQVIGYIVIENGIYVLGVALVGDVPVLVELGVLLDAFVAVLLMGIAIHHISREFEHADADRLDQLKG